MESARRQARGLRGVLSTRHTRPSPLTSGEIPRLEAARTRSDTTPGRCATRSPAGAAASASAGEAAAAISGVALDAPDQVVDLVVLAAIVMQPARDLLHR